MNHNANTALLDAVWEALGTIHPPGWQCSLTELGCVTALFTNGAVVRILLRVPTFLHERNRNDQLLMDLDTVLRKAAPLTDMEYEVKPYQPTTNPTGRYLDSKNRIDFANDTTTPTVAVEEESAATHEHDRCISNAFPKLLRDGWQLDDAAQHLARKSLPADVCAHETVRVLVRALVPTQDNDHIRLRQEDPHSAA
jgi:hypothetical protein